MLELGLGLGLELAELALPATGLVRKLEFGEIENAEFAEFVVEFVVVDVVVDVARGAGDVEQVWIALVRVGIVGMAAKLVDLP